MGTLPPEFSGDVSSQREEATRVATLRSARDMDDVEADRWWGGEARRTRLADPGGTAALVLRRLLLTFSNAELSLDYTPGLDANPWRFGAPLSFGLILALAATGIATSGFGRTGGGRVWLAVVATLATPVLFYVSSRYRLPLALMLCIPAGRGLATLTGFERCESDRSRVVGLIVFVAVALVSIVIPAGDLVTRRQSTALANRSVSWIQRGDVAAAERDLRAAIELAPDSVPAWFGLGRLMQRNGRITEAESSYRRALAINPGSAESAGNLAQILIEAGRPGEAVPWLVQALERRPLHEVCWTNLVIALYSAGDREGARDAVRRAGGLGVRLAPDLVSTVQDGAAPGGEP
jgi:Tfp pilus assembly protein PilF